MRHSVALIFAMLFLSACGSPGNAKFAPSSTSANAPANNMAANQTLTQCQAQSIQSVGGNAVGQIVNSLSVSGLQDAGGSPSLTISTSFSCPGGGEITISATSSLSFTVGVPTSSASLSSGTASLDFQNCSMPACSGEPAVSINGTATLGSMEANVSGNETTGAFSGSASAQLSGNIQVVSGGINFSCAINLTNSESGSGTVSYNPLSATGTDTITTAGSICGIGLNSNIQNAPFSVQ